MAVYKILLIGPRAVGKTAFIERILTGKFSTDYIPSKPHTTRLGLCLDNNERVEFEIHEWRALNEGELDAVFCMYDLSAPDPLYERVYADSIPVIWIGCKSDKVNLYSRDYAMHNNRPNYNTSARANFNLLKPFEHVLRLKGKWTGWWGDRR